MRKNTHLKASSVYVITDTARCSGRGILQGVLRYSMDQDTWKIRIIDPNETGFRSFLTDLAAGRVNGVITSVLENEALVRALEHSSIPLVVVGTREYSLPLRTTNMATITFDEQEIGAEAARYFYHLGKFRTFAFVPHRPPYLQHVSALRAKGFSEELTTHGYKCTTYPVSPSDTIPDIDELAAWLGDLQRPIAILCGHDKRALDVFTACERCAIKIPQEAVLLGVDNDIFACRSVRPEISSIATNFDEQAYSASKLLDELLRRSTPLNVRKEVVCRPHCLIVNRGSTQVLSPGIELVNRARAYIVSNATRRITTSDVISYLHTAKRTVYLRFAQFSDKTLQETITDARLKHVKERLINSQQSIETISRDLGFTNVNNLKHIFKISTGLTMREFRRGLHGLEMDCPSGKSRQ